MSVMCQHLHVWISCEIESGEKGGGVGWAHVCSRLSVCVCGVRGWLPACLCVGLVY